MVVNARAFVTNRHADGIFLSLSFLNRGSGGPTAPSDLWADKARRNVKRPRSTTRLDHHANAPAMPLSCRSSKALTDQRVPSPPVGRFLRSRVSWVGSHCFRTAFAWHQGASRHGDTETNSHRKSVRRPTKSTGSRCTSPYHLLEVHWLEEPGEKKPSNDSRP